MSANSSPLQTKTFQTFMRNPGSLTCEAVITIVRTMQMATRVSMLLIVIGSCACLIGCTEFVGGAGSAQSPTASTPDASMSSVGPARRPSRVDEPTTPDATTSSVAPTLQTVPKTSILGGDGSSNYPPSRPGDTPAAVEPDYSPSPPTPTSTQLSPTPVRLWPRTDTATSGTQSNSPEPGPPSYAPYRRGTRSRCGVRTVADPSAVARDERSILRGISTTPCGPIAGLRNQRGTVPELRPFLRLRLRTRGRKLPSSSCLFVWRGWSSFTSIHAITCRSGRVHEHRDLQL